MQNNTLLIIECKTYGKELDNELAQTKQDGGQVFSYFQQERNAKYLCLYSSDIIENKIKNEYYLISVSDNEEYLNNKKLKSYKEATNNKELFLVWEQTYKKTYETKGLFEDDILAYNIGKQKYTLKDLSIVNNSQIISKLYHKYATILRKYNVSSKENAFDKLVNLFLAKIVDETTHPNDLQFYWKGIFYDNEFDLQDRLQKLYKDGMDNYLKEKVTYIENSQIQEAFKLFKNDPDQTRETILNYFKQLKFFTNNDFAFIDVHNEELFYQNFKILLETIEMLENIKLQQNNNNQFLGDLFEGFLNQGIKQSEGQFFTPLPIVRFIVSSLPLQQMIEKNKDPLNVIDYACGAGHFLTEYAQQISKLITEENKQKQYFSHTIGIEKESRLAKVSKVSCFMFGKDDIKIFYQDGLLNNKNIQNESFDLLIANPPYSVKGFLETLSQEQRQNYELFNDNLNIDTTNAIETFFVERAKQLLKENGICAIILPISIINKDGIYQDTQKFILKYFSIIAIISLPKGTFGQTGTETIVLYLQKRKQTPNLVKHYTNRINSWFKNDFSKDKIYKDFYYVEDYCKYTKQNFKNYQKLFSSDDINLIEQEKEKLLYYILARNNNKKVLILKTPQETKQIQEFLGYKWSKRKGTEGIQYLNSKIVDDDEQIQLNEINSINTQLFNPQDLDDKTKINTLIRKHFNNENFDIPENLQDKLFLLNLEDMLDFSKEKFSSAFNINAMQKIEIESKYKKETLSSIVNINKKSTIQVNVAKDNTMGKYPFFTSGDNVYKIDNYLVDKENIFIATGGKANVKFYSGKAGYSTDTLSIKSNDEQKHKTKYIFNILYSMLNQINILAFKGSGLKHLQKDIFFNIEIPLPPIEIQNKIVAEIDKIENQENLENKKIENNLKSIKTVIENSLNSNKLIKYNLTDNIFELSIGNRVVESEKNNNGDLPVYSANVRISAGKILSSSKENPLKDFNSCSVLWGIDGDWMVNFIDKNISFYPTDHCGILRTINKNINLKFLSFVLYKEGKKHNFSRTNRASIDRISKLSLYLPPIEIQNKVANEISKLEQEIQKSKEILSKIPQQKQGILNKYLKHK